MRFSRPALKLLALLTVLIVTAWVALAAGRYVGALHFPAIMASPLDDSGTAEVIGNSLRAHLAPGDSGPAPGRQGSSSAGRDADAFDDVEDRLVPAVATYTAGPGGVRFEDHSPETELPRLGSPKG